MTSRFGIDIATTSCIQGYSHSNSQKELYCCPLGVECGNCLLAEVVPSANSQQSHCPEPFPLDSDFCGAITLRKVKSPLGLRCPDLFVSRDIDHPLRG